MIDVLAAALTLAGCGMALYALLTLLYLTFWRSSMRYKAPPLDTKAASSPPASPPMGMAPPPPAAAAAVAPPPPVMAAKGPRGAVAVKPNSLPRKAMHARGRARGFGK